MTQDPLSDVVVMLPVMSRWHPWRALRHQSDIDQVWEVEPARLGSWCERTRRIRLNPDLTQAERRCTLTHELVHAELGHTGDCSDAVEDLVDRIAARRLIPIADLLRAVAFYGERWHQVAEECWVDTDTLSVRLNTLHPAERGALLRCLALREESA